MNRMVVDLAAASGMRHLVLCDPSFTKEISSLVEDALDPRLGELANGGRALLLHVPRGDCELTIRLFVDTPPPASLLKAAAPSRLENFRLDVPSGQIEAAGAEDVGKSHDSREPGTFSIARLSGGTFVGSAFHTVRWKLRNRKRYVARRTSPLGRRLRRLQNIAGMSAAVLIVGHVLAIGPLIGLAFWFSRRAGAIAVVLLVLFDLLAWLFFYLLDRAVRTRPVFSEAQLVEEAFERDYPDVVVSLVSARTKGASSPGILVVD